jgi:hypothetical protein
MLHENGRTDMMNLTVPFSSLAKAPNKEDSKVQQSVFPHNQHSHNLRYKDLTLNCQ